MSYQRFQTPRLYADNINWLLSLGRIDTSSTYMSQSGITSDTPAEMFDMKPSNLVTIGGNGASTTHYITINTNISTDANQDANFVAILGHNFKTSDVKFQVQTDDASSFDSDGSFKTPTMTEVVNLDLGGTAYASPGENGWSLATFTQASDNQYIRIRLDPRAGNYDADIKIGCILIGEYFDFPHSPDLSIKKQLIFDGIQTQQSIGGQTYGNASFINGADWFLEPMRNSTETSANALQKSGRVQLDMNFSYMADTDVYPQELYDKTHFIGTNNLLNNVLQRSSGGLHPFLFQYDKDTSNAEDSFLWCRLNNTPTFTQVANRVWSTKIDILEEF